jgi:hypothetical protein
MTPTIQELDVRFIKKSCAGAASTQTQYQRIVLAAPLRAQLHPAVLRTQLPKKLQSRRQLMTQKAAGHLQKLGQSIMTTTLALRRITPMQMAVKRCEPSIL